MDPYHSRRWIIILTIIIVGVVFAFRLLFIQVVDDKWTNRALNISRSEQIIQPPRGLIYDRNKELLVSANQVYDILVTPKDIGETDTMEICRIFKITRIELDEKIKNASTGYNSKYKPSVFIQSMSKEKYALISTKLKQLSGFHSKRNTQRGYPLHVAAHVLGYIGKISKEQYQYQLDQGVGTYSKNDFIGITGIEKTYEEELRGKRGKVFYLKDYAGNNKEVVEEKNAKPGKDIFITLDGKLQLLGEELMQNKMGCIVAIEPKSGEILSMVSAPSFDPELLSGIDFSSNYKILSKNDSLKPLINRPIYNDSYRPGSIFKLIQALVALQEGVITKNTGFVCNKQIIGCHQHEHPYNVGVAIKNSCNPYFYHVYKRLILRGEEKNIFKDSRIGLAKWKEAVMRFGLGVKLKTDIPGVKKGLIPSIAFYDNWYGKNRWAFSTIYSNSIGEGEIGVSPLQMANLAVIIANRGYYYTPHLVKQIGAKGNKKSEFLIKHQTMVDKENFHPVINAMEQVVLKGTGINANIDGISVCGKTGTVENKSFNDHSVFIAFAPKENPQIAIAVYIEYGTWGSTWAAPIASVMIENYLNGRLSEKGERRKEKIKRAIILNKNSDFTF